MTTTGDVLENPVTGERVVIRIGSAETVGACGLVDLYIRSNGAAVGEYWHPAMEERFTVLRGRVGFGLPVRSGLRTRSRDPCPGRRAARLGLHERG
jgi:hypothetical protein